MAGPALELWAKDCGTLLRIERVEQGAEMLERKIGHIAQRDQNGVDTCGQRPCTTGEAGAHASCGVGVSNHRHGQLRQGPLYSLGLMAGYDDHGIETGSAERSRCPAHQGLAVDFNEQFVRVLHSARKAGGQEQAGDAPRGARLAHAAGPRRRARVSSARIEIAISAGESAPMSRPTGPWMRASAVSS